MPIYAYRCEVCGFAKDVLQKVSDPQLTICLLCGEPAFKKQVTAAGFQLKGTGWYATDFRNKAGAAAPAAASAAGEGGDAKIPDAGKNGKDASAADTPGDKKSDHAAPTAGGSAAAGSSSSTGVPKPSGAPPSAG